MTKLHDLLAVQDNLKGQANKVRGELLATFKGKRHLFEGRSKTFTSSAEDAVQGGTEEEKTEIQSTVGGEIAWITPYLAKMLDVAYQVDLANTEAKADVVTEDGKNLLAGVPVTTLLQLEKRVNEIKELIEAIPTLDPAKGFVEDKEKGSGYFKARENHKTRTKKGKKLYIKYVATEKHPAQTELLDEDMPIGTVLEQEWSALLTPGQKSELLDRVEILSRAVSKARSKANEQEIDVQEKKIGAKLLEFVFQPLKGA